MNVDEKNNVESSHSADTATGTSRAIRPQERKLHDPTVSFEEYYHYAQITREEENNTPARKTDWREILLRKKTPARLDDSGANESAPIEQEAVASSNLNMTKKENRINISDKEWTDASRVLRSATWGACFYLITTDVCIHLRDAIFQRG